MQHPTERKADHFQRHETWFTTCSNHDKKREQTFRALAKAPDTVVLVRAVFHLSSLAFQLTAAVVSQFPVLSRLSFQCKVQCTTFILTDTPPATELHTTSTANTGSSATLVDRSQHPTTPLATRQQAHLLWPPYGIGHPVVSSIMLSFVSLPNLSGRRLDVYHTSTHGVALVQIYNAYLKPAARDSMKIQNAKMMQKKSPSGHHPTTLSGCIFATKTRINNQKKKTC